MSVEGYPSADGVGIKEAAQLDDVFSLSAALDPLTDTTTITVSGAGDDATCMFDYDPETGGTLNADFDGC